MQAELQQRWRAWTIVGLSFLALALAYSARAAYGLIMPELEAEFGWSRTTTSTLAAFMLVLTGLLAPIGGRLVDRKGPRLVVLIGLGTLALGCWLAAASGEAWAFVLAFAGVAATGFGLLAVHVVSTAVEQEVDRNSGLAIGIATSGSTAGQLLIVPLVGLLLTAYDWRLAFLALGVAAFVLMLAAARWLPRGLRGDAAAKGEGQERSSLSEDTWFILKSPAFQILFWSYFICGYTTTGVVETHLLPFAALCGFGPVPSATAYGLLSAINLLGMILVGWLTDRMNRPLLLGGIYVIRGFSFIILVNMGSELSTLLLFAVLFGMVNYSTTPVTASLVASHIGLGVMGLAFGLISAGHQIGAALGAYFGGLIFDLYAQYDWVWWSSLGLALLAGFLVLMLRDRPRYRQEVAVT